MFIGVFLSLVGGGICIIIFVVSILLLYIFVRGGRIVRVFKC